jgi:hypothetical protein
MYVNSMEENFVDSVLEEISVVKNNTAEAFSILAANRVQKSTFQAVTSTQPNIYGDSSNDFLYSL